tara:strand:- start:5474 stop:6652 length:1179 start_codon:yes stop_codon:yes gene_type:complete
MSYKILNGNNKSKMLRDESEHIYYDIRLENAFDGTDSSASSNATYNKQTSNILSRQSDYELAVSFWSLRGQIPIFVCPILEGNNNNINDTPFGVCFSFGGVDYSQRIIYAPDSTFNAPLPTSPLNNNGVQDNLSTYYYIYTFQLFITMINTALTASYIAFNAVNGGIHASAPQFQYDAETGLISLIAERSYSQAGGASVNVNALLFNYIEGIRVNFNGYNQPNFKDFNFIFTEEPFNKLGFGIPPNVVTNPPSHNKYTQEYDVRYLWANVKSILITSSSINTRDEYLPETINPNFINQNRNNAFNPNSRTVISYYDIFLDSNGGNGANWRQYLYYEPKIYKWTDLMSDSPLNNINIEIFIQLTSGELLPLSIPCQAVATIKLLFRKKKCIEY